MWHDIRHVSKSDHSILLNSNNEVGVVANSKHHLEEERNKQFLKLSRFFICSCIQQFSKIFHFGEKSELFSNCWPFFLLSPPQIQRKMPFVHVFSPLPVLVPPLSGKRTKHQKIKKWHLVKWKKRKGKQWKYISNCRKEI